MRKIYIVLTYTGTVLSKIIKLFTKNKYTHVSVALDENMDEMYSFGRLNPYNPFIGGFIKEEINGGTFKRFKNTSSQVYSLEVTNEQYEEVKEQISKMYENKSMYKFNIRGLALALFRKRQKRKNKFYCSEFVRYVLENSNIQKNELSNVIKPEDFRKLSELHLEYEGLLRTYNSERIRKVQESIKALNLIKKTGVIG